MKKVFFGILAVVTGIVMMLILKMDLFRFIGLAAIVAGISLCAWYASERIEKKAKAKARRDAAASAASDAPAPTAPAAPASSCDDEFIVAVMAAYKAQAEAEAKAEADKKKTAIEAEAKKIAAALAAGRKAVSGKGGTKGGGTPPTP